MNSNSNYDYVFKFIIIGDSGVGKTSIVQKFVSNKFSRIYDTTIGVEYQMKVLEIDDKKVRIILWDTAGQERYQSIVKSYYRDAIGAFIVYDISNRHSFIHIRRWNTLLGENSEDLCFKTLIANKSDLRNTYGVQVNINEGENIAKKLNMSFNETSAKNGNILDIIEKKARFIIEKIENGEISKYGTNGLITKMESFQITSLQNSYKCCY